MCPICCRQRVCVHPTQSRSKEVCIECVREHGTLTKDGYPIRFYVDKDCADGMYSVIDDVVYGKSRECYVNNMCCYAYECYNRIVIVATRHIQIRKI